MTEYFAFSPDGQTIAYIEDNAVKISDVASGTSKTLRNTFSEGKLLIPSWSPDGQYIGYTDYEAWVEGEELKRFFKVVHVDSGIVSEIIEERYLGYGVWSPTNNTIIYFTINPPPNLSLVSISCIEETHVCAADEIKPLENSVAVEEPSWSPDATEIVAVCYQEEVKNLCLLDLNGIVLKQFDLDLDLSSGFFRIGHPVWSPDGTHIAFSADTTANLPDVYLLSLDTLEISNLTDNPSATNGVPIWIP